MVLVCDRYSAQLSARLRELQSDSTTRAAGADGAAASSTLTIDRNSGRLPDRKNRWVTDGEEERKQFQSRLIQAGIYNRGALFAFLLIRTGLTLLPPLLGLLAGALHIVSLQFGLLCGAIASGTGMFLPMIWLESRIRYRHIIFRQSLADCLDLMIVCLESGLSLQGSLQRVGDELRVAHPEFAAELSIVQRDIGLGATIDSALRRFAARSGCEDIGSLAKFVREAQRFGTRLTDALRINADMLRSQRENAAEEMAQQAAVKMLLPTLLLILPATFIVLAGPAVIKIQQVFAK